MQEYRKIIKKILLSKKVTDTLKNPNPPPPRLLSLDPSLASQNTTLA